MHSTLIRSTVAFISLLSAPTLAIAGDVYLETKLIPTDLDSSEWAGKDVAIDGDWAALAVPRDIVGGQSCGAVQVYRHVAGGWSHFQKLRPLFLQEHDAFGTCVAIQGDLLAVGAVGDDDHFAESGAVYLYAWSGSAWQLTQTLYASDPSIIAAFGSEIEIDGDRMAIGARSAGTAGNRTGAVYVFVKQGGNWVFEDKLVASDGADGDHFGSTLDLHGDRIVVGALLHDALAPEAGAAYVFGRTGSTWSQLQKLTAFDGGLGDRFGRRVAVWEDRVVVSSPQDNALVSGGGSVYSFVETSGVYSLEQKITANVPLPGSEFGSGLDLHADLLVIGASDYSNHEPTLYVFRFVAANWMQTQSIVQSEIFASSRFAEDVETDGVRILAGAPEDYVGFFGQEGSGFLYVVPPAIAAYCAAKVSSAGCVPSIAWTGEPSASGASTFVISAAQVPNRQYGMFFYSTGGRAALPFQGGTLCVETPVLRTFAQNSGGTPPPASDCTGILSIDFAAEITSRASLVAGTQVHGQFWFRDPGDPTGPGLSNAIEFVILP